MTSAKFGRHLLQSIVLYLLILLSILVIFLVARRANVDFFMLTKDPLAGKVESTPIYSSILSNLGVMGWCFTIAVQFYSVWILRRLDERSQFAAFLFWSGLLTLLLMLDDFLMLHERLDHTAELFIYGAYGLLVATILMRFHRVIFGTNFLILAAALGFFLLSMVLDNIVERLSIEIPYRTMLEDAFKITGIAGWVYYYIGVSVGTVREALPEARDSRVR